MDSTSVLYSVGVATAAIWLVATIYFCTLFVQRKILLRKFRGPFAVPMIGNIWDPNSWSLFRFLTICRKKFGKIFVIFPFSKAYLVCSDPVVVRRILSDTKVFVKGGDYKDIFSVVFGEGLVTSNGEKHKHDRGVFGKYFIKSNVSNYVTLMNTTTKAVIDSHISKKLSESGGTMDLNAEHFFATLALKVFLKFSLNHTIDDTSVLDSMCRAASKGSYSTGMMMMFNLPMWSIFPAVQDLHDCKKVFLGACQSAFDDRKTAMERGECDDMDDCLTAMIREKLPQKQVEEHLMTLVCAGHDTTAFFSAFMALVLAQNPDCQDKLRAEILGIVGDKDEITMEDLSKMTYLQKVMQETLRVYAVIPLLTREASEEVTIKEANVTIPKGAVIMVPLFMMNRDPAVWKNPSAFDPDRFDGKSVEFTQAKNGFFPFGYGSRTCIGNTLALTEAGVFFTHLLRKFRLEELPGFKPLIMGGISLTTSNGVQVVLKEL